MKSCIVALLLMLSLVAEASATAQIPDTLIYQGQRYALNSNPLEVYFDTHPDRKPPRGSSSNLWRGYIATFEIRDSLLSVVEVEIKRYSRDSAGTVDSWWESSLTSVFPDSAERACTFYTGLLILPMGEATAHVNMGYSSLYERYILLLLEGGKLRKSREFSGSEYLAFKRRQFEAYKKSDEYKKMVEELTKENSDTSQIENFLFIYDVNYSSKFLLDEL